jgi:hypothetical protein
LLRIPDDPVARRLAALGAMLLAAFACVASTRPAPGRTLPFLAAFAAAFVLYAAAAALVLRDGRSAPGDAPAAGGAPDGRPDAGAGGTAAAIAGFAILFRLVFLFLPPALSTDLARYVWDGRVLLAGFNPYRHAPAEPELAALRGAAPYADLDHRDVRTIYPPGAQLLFAAGAAGGAIGIKTLVVAADLAVAACLAFLLRRRGLPQSRALLYAWNPLVVVETAWSGHLEPAGIACLVAGAAAIIQKRPVRGALLVAGAGLVKVLPWALLIPLRRRLNPGALAAATALGIAAYWPFRGAGAALAAGLGEYASRWEGNGAIFPLVRAAIAAIDPTPWLKAAIGFLKDALPGGALLQPLYAWVYPQSLARAACAALALGAAFACARRVPDPLRALFLTVGAALLLSPTVHPWYLLWIVPFLAFFPSRAWILLTGLVALAYLNLGVPAGAPPHRWVPLAEYLPFAMLLIADRARARRGRDAARDAGRGVPLPGGDQVR